MLGRDDTQKKVVLNVKAPSYHCARHQGAGTTVNTGESPLGSNEAPKVIR